MRWLIAAAVIGLLSTSAFAKTLKVPQKFATISEAVAAAKANDLIEVSPGTYAETVVLDGRSKIGLLGHGNVVIDGGGVRDGLVITNCNTIGARGFRFRNCVNAIRIVNTTTASVSLCRIFSPTGDGIQIDSSSQIALADHTIDHPAGNGINGTLGTGVQGSRISRTTITAAGLDGISIIGDGSPLTKITVLGAAGDGIQTNGVGSRVKDSTVRDAQNGIVTLGGGSWIKHCSVRGCRGIGIETSGNQSFIYDTNVTRNQGNGIVTHGTGGKVTRVAVANMLGFSSNGIITEGVDAFVERANVNNFRASGIVTSGLGGHVRLSNVNGHGHGIDGIVSNAAGSEVSDSTARLVTRFGIHAAGGSGTFLNNEVQAAGAAGIEVSSASNVFRFNTVTVCPFNGFHVTATSNQFRHNTAKGAGNFDVLDEIGGNAYVANKFGKVSIP